MRHTKNTVGCGIVEISSTLAALAGVAVFLPETALASTLSYQVSDIRASSSSQMSAANSSPVIPLHPAQGVNISFLKTDETIVTAWLDDPSQIALNFNGAVCPATEKVNCQGHPATVIHLKQITDIFEGQVVRPLPSAPVTLLTVITRDTSGQDHLYTFLVSIVPDGSSAYHTVNITPSEMQQPIATNLLPVTPEKGQNSQLTQSPQVSLQQSPVAEKTSLSLGVKINPFLVNKGLQAYRKDNSVLAMSLSNDEVWAIRRFLHLSETVENTAQALALANGNLEAVIVLQELAQKNHP
jgi:hypothetical protein